MSVTVTAASTQTNESLNGLVTSINNALSTAGLASEIAASRDGSQVVLSAVNSSVTQFQVQIADPTNPAVTELGFAQGQNSALAFKFSTIQSLATLLSSLMGVSANPQYNPTTNLLSFTLDFTGRGILTDAPAQLLATGLGSLCFDGCRQRLCTGDGRSEIHIRDQPGGIAASPDRDRAGTRQRPAHGRCPLLR